MAPGRLAPAIAGLLVLPLFLFLVVAPVSATDVTPILVEDNPSCPDLGYEFGFKIEGSTSGTYYLTSADGELSPTSAPEDPNNYVTITSDGIYVDWTSTLGIDAVLVKGGPDMNLYAYAPEATSDSGLHSPINPNNDMPFAISHVDFCYDYEVTVTKTAQTSFTRTYEWSISKEVTPTSWDIFRGDSGTSLTTIKVEKVGYTDSDWAVEGTITITNPAPVSATITDISDVIAGVGSASVSCDIILAYALASLESLTCSYSSDLPDGTNRVNTATVTTSGIVGGNTGTADVDFGSAFITEVLASVSVTDTVVGDLGTFADSGSTSYTSTFSCDSDEGTHDNTATIVETGQSASASLTVACYELNVAKSVRTSFTRTYSWNIEKIADQSELVLSPTQEFLVNYLVSVDATFVDSDWAAAGTLSIHNPAPRDATLTGVNDIVSGAGAATVDCGVTFPYVLPPGGTLTCTYSVSLPDPSSRVNTATTSIQNYGFWFDGSATAAGTTDFSASALVDFGGADISEVDACVGVSDSYAGPLGTICAGSAPASFSYSRVLGPFSDRSQCGDNYVTNTASFVAGDTQGTGSAEWTIHVFVPCASGCTLTIGFWKTHAGFNGNNADVVTQYLPIWLGEAGGAMSVQVTSAAQAVSILSFEGSNGVFAPSNGVNKLYAQLLGAKLNIANGADGTDVASLISVADTFLASHDSSSWSDLNKATKNTILAWAAMLDDYNNGVIGPGHCSE